MTVSNARESDQNPRAAPALVRLRTTLFGGRASPGGWSASALSRNGRMLYFASGKRVWSYDTFFDVVRGPQLARTPVVGLAFSPDGRRVFAARADGGVLTLDAAKGTPLAA